MKLSQMNNDQMSDFLVRVATPIGKIMDDEEMQPMLEQVSKSRSLPLSKLIANLLPKVVTFGIVKHKKDLYEIVGAFSEKPIKEVGKMNIMETLNVLKESIDKDFLDFFKSFGEQGGEQEN